MHCYPHVTARTFHRFTNNGRTAPAIFSCCDEYNETAEYVVKFHGKIAGGTVSELIACELGKLLGIPVAPGAVVDIDDRLGNAAPELAVALRSGAGPHFASKHYAGGYSIFSGHYLVPNDLVPVAIDIFAWDMLLQNPDRQKSNPNLLYNGSQFLVFDHELACAFEAIIGGYDPFHLHGTKMERDHVLRFAFLRHVGPTSFDGFASRLSALQMRNVEELLGALPATWCYPQRTDAVLTHFAAVLADVDKFRDGLLGIFS